MRVLTSRVESYIVVFMAEVLGAFEQAVLLTVLRLGRDAYGRAVWSGVCERLERDVAAGAVHATLARLERKGLLSSELAEGTEIRAGRPRRFYRVEPGGVRALNDARRAVDALWRGVGRPLKGTA
jgi:PadR family transcriptional regulator, regulatory protein PadR